MANNTSALYTSVLLPLALQRLVERMQGLRYIRNDISSEVLSKNKNIIIELNTDSFTARDFTGETVAQDVNANSKTITLDKHKEVTFTLSDQEMLEISTSGLLNDVISNAINAVAKAPVTDFYNLYKEVYAHSGTNASNPFASDDIFDAESKMFDNLIEGDKVVALGGKAYTQLSKELKNSGVAADGIASSTLQTGELPRISDSFLFRDQLLTNLKHVSGTASNDILFTSDVTAVDATEITVDGASVGTTFLTGDIFTVDDDSEQQFVVTADVTSAGVGATIIPVSPKVKIEIAGATSITYVGNHNVNLMYSRDFAIFAMRALSQPTNELGLDGVNSLQNVIVDPNTGISMRFEAHRIPKKKSFEWTFDILYAVETIDPIYACRILPS